MSDRPNKRKEGPGGANGTFKKSRGGANGKWQTPFQKSRKAEKVEMGTALAVGDAGVWVTYARGMNGKAQREFKELCYTYGESLYGIKAPNAEEDEGKEDEEQDIEASIQAELEGMKTSQKPKERQVFSFVQTSIECVFFMKTMDPVDPERLVRQMCQDAKACPDPRQRKTKYVNRLTPVMDTDKATETGIERVARAVLASHFTLNPAEKAEGAESSEDSTPGCTYAIRHNIRNHKVFKSDALIKKVASFVSPRHKVNLTQPDKVILVEIFQNHCGVSVVNGTEWEDLKRYNLNELYKLELEKAEKADAAAAEEKKADAVVEESKADAAAEEKPADATSEERKAETATEGAAAAV